jgi:5-methylcytosine-specific restriction endonuclease McrA
VNSGPSAQFQLDFIERFQRLLDSGGFVATYKYALLISLCNIAAEQGFDDARPQRIQVSDLGQQFMRLYWNHVRHYPGVDHPLRQNTGKPAAILNTVAQARESVEDPDRADALDSVPETLLRQAAERVRSMPLMKLQTIGRQKDDPDHPDNFVYPTRVEHGCIELRPGVSACLRRFRPLLVSTTQTAWSDYVRRTNPELGAGHDLDRFLFGADRVALHPLAPALMELQEGRCFYTGRPLRDDAFHVDHFIPWSKFPLNTSFNLVLASRAANLQKSDHLAAVPHLRRWHERNLTRHNELLRIGATGQDYHRCVSIAEYTYSTAARLGTLGWLRGRTMDHLELWVEALQAS